MEGSNLSEVWITTEVSATTQITPDTPIFSQSAFTAVSIYLFFAAVLGVPINIFIIVLFIKHKHLRSPMNLLFINLAVSDAVVGTFGSCLQFASTTFRWYMAETPFCNVYGFMTFLGGMASLGSLTLISFERYLAVVRPVESLATLTYRGATFVIVIVWIFALVWAGGPLVGWSDYVPEGLGTWCSVNWARRDSTNQSYVLCIFILGFFFPVGIILFSYGSVWRKVKEVADSQQGVSSASKAEKTIIKMSAAMVTCYMLAWSPYAVVSMIGSFGDPDSLVPLASTLPALFAKSSMCYNPVIYVGMNKPFRTEIFKTVFRGWDPFDRKQGGETGDPTAQTTHKVAPA